MPKYTVIQSYTAQDIYKNVEAVDVQDAIDKIGGLPVDENNHQDIYKNVEAVDVQDAIDKIGGLPVDENNHQDTETEVKLEEE